MARKADTHIRVTENNWTRLNRLKRPGESFNDVIGRLLNETDDGETIKPDGGRQKLIAHPPD